MAVVAVDAMGGDHGPLTTVPAVIHSLELSDSLFVVLVGDLNKITPLLPSKNFTHPRLTLLHASEEVLMGEQPAKVLRSKRDYSLKKAINLVKSSEADACVSAGNTGAFMALGRHLLKTLSGIDRPALAATIPTLSGQSLMLDLGANVDCSSKLLLQFSIMGSVLAETLFQKKSARVSLLNVGTEDIKGNSQIKEVAEQLKQSHLINFQGYIEGNNIFSGHTDVIVCDGFVGNVVIKTSEGLVGIVLDMVKEAFSRQIMNKLIGMAALPVLREMEKDLVPAICRGASMLGLKGVLIKSHGKSDAKSFSYSILQAEKEAELNLIEKLESALLASEQPK